ncbi:hypothetical protein F511_17435 [Dorcoceras hygrometricum]|uniref:B3 domain-containing protein n=1 Tax=Dorcoceras hygrometricum TaxID=472368 RepID=A0A2Z7D535_9LAMI|nr:hypothetical protein F511_17435 [Dorcoceras hygrometricum]
MASSNCTSSFSFSSMEPIIVEDEDNNHSSVSSGGGTARLKTIMLLGKTITVGSVASKEPAVDGPDHDDGRWTIKNNLERSDVNGSSSLLRGNKLVILDHIGEFDPERGMKIDVYDADTETIHTLVLKKWKTNSYVLNKGWIKDFVKRRVLKKNDQTGLRWEEHHRRLEFTIIKRAIISTINFF